MTIDFSNFNPKIWYILRKSFMKISVMDRVLTTSWSMIRTKSTKISWALSLRLKLNNQRMSQPKITNLTVNIIWSKSVTLRASQSIGIAVSNSSNWNFKFFSITIWKTILVVRSCQLKVHKLSFRFQRYNSQTLFRLTLSWIRLGEVSKRMGLL